MSSGGGRFLRAGLAGGGRALVPLLPLSAGPVFQTSTFGDEVPHPMVGRRCRHSAMSLCVQTLIRETDDQAEVCSREVESIRLSCVISGSFHSRAAL